MITYVFTFSMGSTKRSEEIKVEDIGLGYSDEEWNEFSESVKHELLKDAWVYWISSFVSAGWYLKE